MSAIIGRLQSSVEGLPPGYFAMVMATGIVSIACHLLGLTPLPAILFRLNIAFYAILWLLLLSRITLYPHRFLADLGSHARGAGYFTMVAATCILGNQFVILEHSLAPALVLLSLGVLLWILLIYGIFTLFTVHTDKPAFEKAITGTWLVAVVATQSLSILSGLVGLELTAGHEVLAFFSVCTFFVGSMLYILIITLIFYRFMFFEFKPEDLSHSYWINMGAVAITTLAGTVLIKNSVRYPFLHSIQPFTTGFTLFFWANATWWIPFLLALGVWYFMIRRQRIYYDPTYWSVVFPLGMYTTCTLRLSEVLGLEFLIQISNFFIFAALIAWGLTFIGLILSIARR